MVVPTDEVCPFLEPGTLLLATALMTVTLMDFLHTDLVVPEKVDQELKTALLQDH
ncbi:MAG: hypothetical protein ISR65_07610 [Bacteriovoracaceae bacterium]|nr:hypothetical protein [Bacteriovoracaceae bacterium]